MLDPHTKKDIDKISNELLRSSKALGVFPTPIDKIVQYAELSVSNNIDLSKVDPGFMEKFSGNLKSAMSKILGMLDREEKVIYLDLNQPTKRKNFIQLHEVGHDVLPWQSKTLRFLEDKNTIDPYIMDGFETEANYFASATLFQQARFANEINKLPFELKTSLHLAKLFGASFHATIRRYVEKTNNRCALLVLENLVKNSFASKCDLRNYFQSESFTTEFGQLNWPDELPFKFGFIQDFSFGRKLNEDGILKLNTDNGELDFQYHFFNNTYNAFVLLFPKGETKKSKVTFKVSE